MPVSPRELIPLPLRLRLYDLRHRRDPPARRFPGLERVPAGERRIVLTFDDGPDEDATPAVLDALDAIGARATFFVVGEQVGLAPDLLDELVRRGHEIGLHGFRHVRHASFAAGEATDDLRRGVAALEGIDPHWYRPPFGRFSDESFRACRELGLAPAYWSAWGIDWEPLPAARVAALACRGLADGSVILLHDSSRYASRESALATAEALPLIAERATAAGLRFATLGEAARPR